MIKKVGVIKGHSQYNVIRSWALQLERGFEKLGVETVVYDLKYHTNFEIYDDIDCFIGFSGWGVKEFTQFDKPFVMIMADQVIEHTDEIKLLREQDILFVMDKYDIEMLDLLGFTNLKTFFLPHASIEYFNENCIKTIDCLFLGSYAEPEQYVRDLQAVQPEDIKQYFLQLLEHLKNNPQLHYANFILQQFKNSGVTINAYENSDFLILVSKIGRYFYAKQRIDLIRNLVENNLEVHIYGNGWNRTIFDKSKNLHIHPAVDFYRAQNLMKVSKITLNMQPFLVSGTHERVYSAIANNSIALTNETIYLKELFKETEGVVFYDSLDTQKSLEKILSILAMDAVQYNSSVKGSFDRVIESYTYEDRAKEIIDRLTPLIL